MTVKLIAENILNADHFLSATEQEGERIGQPVPAAANTGALRLLAKGDVANFTYSGTATGDGAVGGTTVIDSVLAAYGDDYFIGGTIAITSGACSGESKSITDFAQATGTITTAAFTAQIVTGVTFTLTVAFASRDFVVELIAGGDTGDATFKWSHDGGTTYLGRDNPNQATYLAPTTIGSIHAAVAAATGLLAIDDNEALAFLYTAGPDVVCYATTDNGITWALRGTVVPSGGNTFGSVIKLASGRILASIGTIMYYSDDGGVTWAVGGMADPGAITFTGMCENSGTLIGVYFSSSIVYCKVNTGGDASWSAAITIASDANSQLAPDICVAENGDLVCVYSSDEDALNDFEIKCKISSDGGATWGSAIAVINFSTDVSRPHIIKDINGDLYCYAERADADISIVASKSTNNGATWGTGSVIVVATGAGKDYGYPSVTMVNGHEIWVSWANDTDDVQQFARRGIWEAYSANACQAAIEATEQKLICDAGIVWHGGAGIVGDIWTFEPEYDYAMSNLIEDSPSKPWRSEQDNIACAIVLDMGTNVRHFVDGVGFFGCNLRTLNFQMNATDSWGAPSVNEAVSFDLTTAGVVDAVAGNVVTDAALMASYKDHELAGKFLRMTSGTDDGVTWRILDNAGDYIYLETTAANNIAVSDTFAIFQDHISKTFTGGVYRFIRISIAAQQTADNYYQIGTMVGGRALTLSSAFSQGFTKALTDDIEFLRTPQGGLIPIQGAEQKAIFGLSWSVVDAAKTEVTALVKYCSGKNICLIPDTSNLKDCYLVKQTAPAIELQHRARTFYDFAATFEEVL